ncbi:MAG: membrane protein insertion efficiency factor YidD [Planctomycetota bacterium]
MRFIGSIIKLPARIVIWIVRMYQVTISPLYGDVCKYEPSCSHYFIQAVQKYGLFFGSLKGLWRICRCNPFSKGGIDPP